LGRFLTRWSSLKTYFFEDYLLFIWMPSVIIIYLIISSIYYFGNLSLFEHLGECGKKSALMACFPRFKVFFSEKRFYF